MIVCCADGKKIASGVGASERGILQLRLRRYVLLRGQFPQVRVLSKWTQLRLFTAALPRAALSVLNSLLFCCPWPSWSSNLHHPHARKLLLPCSRRSSWPQALTLRRTREGMQDAHSSVSDRRSSSSAARTLFRRCSTPSCIDRFKFISHSHIDRPSTHYDCGLTKWWSRVPARAVRVVI